MASLCFCLNISLKLSPCVLMNVNPKGKWGTFNEGIFTIDVFLFLLKTCRFSRINHASLCKSFRDCILYFSSRTFKVDGDIKK